MSNAKGKPIYKRILLKLSGEALMGDADFGIDPKVIDRMSTEIKDIIDAGVQVYPTWEVNRELFNGKLSISTLASYSKCLVEEQ